MPTAIDRDVQWTVGVGRFEQFAGYNRELRMIKQYAFFRNWRSRYAFSFHSDFNGRINIGLLDNPEFRLVFIKSHWLPDPLCL